MLLNASIGERASAVAAFTRARLQRAASATSPLRRAFFWSVCFLQLGAQHSECQATVLGAKEQVRHQLLAEASSHALGCSRRILIHTSQQYA